MKFNQRVTIEELLKMLDKYKFKRFDIHHTWKPNYANLKTNTPEQLNTNMKTYHIGQNYGDIAQHITTFPDGTILIGRDFGKRPVSIANRNTGAFAMEQLGDFDYFKDVITVAQRNITLQLIKYFKSRGTEIAFHRDYSSKTCPGTSLNKQGLIEASDYHLKTGELRKGITGEDVLEVQNLLEKKGYPIKWKDGAFGDEVVTQIKAFQKENGLSQTGIVDNITLSKLKCNTEIPTPPISNDKVKIRYKDKVKEVRRVLKDGENYVNVREVMEVTDHKVDWDEAKQEIVIDGDVVINEEKITGYGKYYKTGHLEVVETYPNGIYAQFVGGKTCRQTGAYSGSGVYFDPLTAPVTNSRSIVAIAVNGGKPIGENAHTADYTNRYKRGAIVTRPDNTAEFMRINNVNEIKGPYNVVLGGISMGKEYNPVKEGFIPANKNDDVLRSTMHTALACKKDRVYHITSLGNCTLAKFNEYIMKELGLEHIVGLDGGGSSQLYFEGNKGKPSSRLLPMVIGFKKVG